MRVQGCAADNCALINSQLAVDYAIEQVLRQPFQADCAVCNACFDRQVSVAQIFDRQVAIAHGLSCVDCSPLAVGDVGQRALHASGCCVRSVNELNIDAAFPAGPIGQVQAVVTVYGVDLAGLAELSFNVSPHQHRASKLRVVALHIAKAACRTALAVHQLVLQLLRRSFDDLGRQSCNLWVNAFNHRRLRIYKLFRSDSDGLQSLQFFYDLLVCSLCQLICVCRGKNTRPIWISS